MMVFIRKMQAVEPQSNVWFMRTFVRSHPWCMWVQFLFKRTRDDRMTRKKCLNNKLNFQEESWMLLFLSKRKYITQVKKGNNRNIGDGVQLSKFWRMCAENVLPFWQFYACVWGEILRSEKDLVHLHCILQHTTVNVVDYTDLLSDMWETVQSLKRLWTISYSPYKPIMDGQNIHDNVNLNMLPFPPFSSPDINWKAYYVWGVVERDSNRHPLNFEAHLLCLQLKVSPTLIWSLRVITFDSWSGYRPNGVISSGDYCHAKGFGFEFLCKTWM